MGIRGNAANRSVAVICNLHEQRLFQLATAGGDADFFIALFFYGWRLSAAVMAWSAADFEGK